MDNQQLSFQYKDLIETFTKKRKSGNREFNQTYFRFKCKICGKEQVTYHKSYGNNKCQLCYSNSMTNYVFNNGTKIIRHTITIAQLTFIISITFVIV